MEGEKLPGADLVEYIESLISGVAMAVLLLAIFVDVFFREVVSYPILWLQEISMFSYMWLIFAGAAVAARRGTHYKLDLIDKVVKSKRLIALIRWLVLLLSLSFALMLAYQGVGFTQLGLKRVSRPSGIPLFVVFVALPIAGVSMGYFFVEKLLQEARTGRRAR